MHVDHLHREIFHAECWKYRPLCDNQYCAHYFARNWQSPSWISGRERMTVEIISWSISTKECFQPGGGRTRSHLIIVGRASNWDTKVGQLALIKTTNNNIQTASPHTPGPEVIKHFCMHNWAEHEVCQANKSQMNNNCQFFLTKYSWSWTYLC